MSEVDDRWMLRQLAETESKAYEIGGSTYRYMDENGVVHRAVWAPSKPWQSLCGLKVTVKLQENDPGAITCVRCLGEGG